MYKNKKKNKICDELERGRRGHKKNERDDDEK